MATENTNKECENFLQVSKRKIIVSRPPQPKYSIEEIREKFTIISNRLDLAMEELEEIRKSNLAYRNEATLIQNMYEKEEVIQLKKEVVQLKEENSSLKAQIQKLWNLFVLFLSKKLTATKENWASFFSKNKDAPLTCTFIDEKVNDSKTKP